MDEDTAIVVRGDEFEVIGRSHVAIYDNRSKDKKRSFYFLSPGDRFDMKRRQASRPAQTLRPLELAPEP